MNHLFFPDSGAYSRRPLFPDSDDYSRRPFFSDSGSFFPDSGTYSRIFPDTGAYSRHPFFHDSDACPCRYFADDKHSSTKAAKHKSAADNDRSQSRDGTSVPVHYADKHQSGFADHKHRSMDDNSVPIHYVNNKHPSGFTDHKHANDKHRSTKSDRSAAAIKIQKIFRGFLVRKNMRTVRKITAEMAEIAHQISALKSCDNAKQRLWIGEKLMALLLRLDAVRGVREYRKKAIRRVIQFQEAVDSIAQGSVETADFTAVKNCADPEIDDSSINIEDTIIEEAVDDDGDIACREINRESSGVRLSIEDPMEESLETVEVIPSTKVEELVAIKEATKRAAAAENETLKKMVEELCQRSQQQCELLRGLVRQVESLETRVQDMELRERETENH